MPHAILIAMSVDVKQLRERLGLTGQDLAVAIGVSVSTISRWENGKNRPSKLALARIKEVANKQTGVGT